MLLDLELLTTELLLDLELLTELDDLLIELLMLDLLLDVVVPHKVPFTVGAPAVPFAWKPKLAEAFGASVLFHPNAVAV
jgi:hypothetical protein